MIIIPNLFVIYFLFYCALVSLSDKIWASSDCGKEIRVLIVNLKALLERKSAIEKRRVTFKVVQQETGIKALTLSRIATNHNYNFSRKDLEKLLIYFNCQPNDLLTLIKEEERS